MHGGVFCFDESKKLLNISYEALSGCQRKQRNGLPLRDLPRILAYTLVNHVRLL